MAAVCRRGGCPNPPAIRADIPDGWAGYCDAHLAQLRARLTQPAPRSAARTFTEPGRYERRSRGTEEHGTERGYQQHRSRGTEACDECKAGHRAHEAARHRANPRVRRSRRYAQDRCPSCQAKRHGACAGRPCRCPSPRCAEAQVDGRKRRRVA